ncbi:MAG: hypothetical protein HOQ02_01175 [Lysobacter sp.]|nr:hypothetical protein [Lysobacter sp.]
MLSELRSRLKRHEGSYPKISALHEGLTYSWVTKFAHGQAENPTVANLQALKEALDAFEGPSEAAAPVQTATGAAH